MQPECINIQECLQSVQPQIGNYQWMLKLLRVRAGKNGEFPVAVYEQLKRLGNPKKPYFIGETCDGIRFLGDYRDFPSVSHALWPEWNNDLSRFMQSRINPEKGAYLDVGTNLGVVAATMARFLAGKQEVVAFEPVPETARRAASTFALNGLTNIRLYQMAVGDEQGEITFYASPGNSAIATAHESKFGYMNTWVETKVPCQTLDWLLDAKIVERVGFIKLDVEGHEPKAVRGAQQLISRDKPTLIYEYTQNVSEEFGWTATDVSDMISKSAAYRFEVLHDKNTLTPFPPTAADTDQVNIVCEAV